MKEIDDLSFAERYLHSHLHDIGFRWLKYVTKTIGKIGLNEIVTSTLWDESHSIATSISLNDPAFFNIVSENNNIIFKYNHYTLTIIVNKVRKYKITMGINAKIARNNFVKAIELWPDNPSIKTTHMITGNNFFVECSDIIPGLNFRSFFFKNNLDDPIIDAPDFDIVKNLTIDKIFNFFVAFMKEMYNASDKEYVYYSNDTQVSNFLLIDIEQEPKLISIDFDHITKSTVDVFVENCCRNFFSIIHDDNEDYVKFFTENWKNYVISHTKEESIAALKKKVNDEIYR